MKAWIDMFKRTKLWWIFLLLGIAAILISELGCASRTRHIAAVPAIQTPACPQVSRCPECEECALPVILQCYKTEAIVVFFSTLDDDGNRVPEKSKDIPGSVDEFGCRCLVSFEEINWISTGIVDDSWCEDDEK